MWVRSDSIGEGECKGCKAPITWVESLKTGKKMPLNGHGLAATKTDRVPDRNGDIVSADYFDLKSPHRSDLQGEVSHFATCPEALRFRKTGKHEEHEPTSQGFQPF